MNKRAIRALCLLLAFALLLPCAAASAEAAKEERPLYHFDADFSQESLGEAIERYLTEKGQNSVKVAIGWQDLESGEEYYFHPDYFYAGASFYKLPLAMAYADKVAEGELSLDDKVGPYVLRDALEMILVNSNNPAGRALRDHLVPDEPAFKRLIVPYSGIAEEDLPRGYFCGNHYSPRFMIGVLRTLHDDPEHYGYLVDWLKQARPKEYFSRYRGELEVAHKYGDDGPTVNDCGIIYAQRPFLLCVMCYQVPGARFLVGEIARIAMDYAEYLAAQPSASPRPEAESGS